MSWIYWYLGNVEGLCTTLYVGKTTREPWERQAEHRRRSGWYEMSDRGRCELWVPSDLDLAMVEQGAIDVLNPWYNDRAAWGCCQRDDWWRCHACREMEQWVREALKGKMDYDLPWHLAQDGRKSA